MKFGHVTPEKIGDVEFLLPPDHEDSYSGAKPKVGTKYFVGCGKWGIKEWVGPLYPEGTREKEFLSHYLRNFNSIELNGTFYRLSRSSIEKWAEEARDLDFVYCPKWSQRISHFKRLEDVEENTQYFMDSVALLGESLGQSFLTLPPNLGPIHMERLKKFVNLLPDHYPAQIEFRHKDWFAEPTFRQVVDILKGKGIGTVITDVALRRDALHMCLTSPNAFVRFNGYGLHATDFSRLDAWIERLAEWEEKGIEKVFFFMHQENEAHTIVLCDYFIKKMNAKLQTNLRPLNLKS